MDTLKLRAFMLVVKHKSFSGAAQDLSYTPSALSHMADALEQELGVKLFNRTKRGVTLTKDGQRLQQKIEAMLNAEDELLKLAVSINRNNEHLLRIGTYASIALHVLPQLLHSFKQKYPLIKTQILVADDMHSWLDEGTVDVVLADREMGMEPFFPLIEDAFVAVVPADDFPNREEISLEELYPYPLIRPREESLDNFLSHKAFKEVISVDSVENDSAVYMVKEGLGVTVLPRLNMCNCPRGVKILKLKETLSRTIGFLYDVNSHTKACQWFVEHISKISQDGTLETILTV